MARPSHRRCYRPKCAVCSELWRLNAEDEGYRDTPAPGACNDACRVLAVRSVHQPCGGPHGRLRVYRGMVQSASSPFGPRLPSRPSTTSGVSQVRLDSESANASTEPGDSRCRHRAPCPMPRPRRWPACWRPTAPTSRRSDAAAMPRASAEPAPAGGAGEDDAQGFSHGQPSGGNFDQVHVRVAHVDRQQRPDGAVRAHGSFDDRDAERREVLGVLLDRPCGQEAQVAGAGRRRPAFGSNS